MGGKATRRAVREALRKACSRHLWMAVPKELEDYIVGEAVEAVRAEDVDASYHGALFELAVRCAVWYHTGALDLDRPLEAQALPWLSDEWDGFAVITSYDAVVAVSTADSVGIGIDCDAMDDADFYAYCANGYAYVR